MQKKTKSADELKELLLESMQKTKVGGDVVIVPNPAYGWSAMAIAAPAIVVDLQARIEPLVKELRSRFSLA